MQLHEEIRRARKELHFSQAELAALAGVQRRQISVLENGGNVTLSTIRKVIAQLPNIQRFTLSAAEVNVEPRPLLKEDWDRMAENMRMIGEMYQKLEVLMAEFNAAMAAGNREEAERIAAEAEKYPTRELQARLAEE